MRIKASRRRPAVVTWLSCLVLAALPFTAPAAADDWNGTISLGWIGLDSDGSEASFRTQTGLDEGVWLEELRIAWDDDTPGGREFEFSARGFGDAEPADFARLLYRSASPWTFRLDYDQRESFFRLTETGLGLREDDWEISRWRASVEYGGWQAADLALALRFYERDGTIDRPFLGLNELYPQRVSLDETMNEVAFRLSTKTLPIRLDFEQTWTVYERENRYSGSGATLGGDATDPLIGQSTDRSDEIEAPTSRLVATWRNDRVDFAAQALYSPAELDSSGVTDRAFDIEGGRFGRFAFVDDLLGSADFDTTAVGARVGFRIASAWELRLIGDYRDRSTDTVLLGERLLRLTNPLGQVVDIGVPADDSSLLDITDEEMRAELHWTGDEWSAWAGGFLASRDSQWRIGHRDGTDVERETDGTVIGVGYRPTDRLRLSAEWEHGSFDQFAFRTEPETVDRYSLQVNTGLGGGFELGVQGKVEEADNPLEIADLDHSSTSLGSFLSWADEKGNYAGVGLDWNDIDTRTALVLPGGGPGLSRYDLELLTTSAWGGTDLGPVNLSGSLLWLDDGGDTWPVESWNGRVRLGFDVAERTELSLFGEYWDYDEGRADGDDYEVTRYGVTLRWSWQ